MTEWCEKDSPGAAKAITVYDASDCLTSAYKWNKNYYYIPALQQDWLIIFLQNICTLLLRII